MNTGGDYAEKISEIHGVRLRYMGLPVKSVPENDCKSARKRLQMFAVVSGQISSVDFSTLPYLIALKRYENGAFLVNGRFSAINLFSGMAECDADKKHESKPVRPHA